MTTPTYAFQQTWQRILGAINARNDSCLAKFLGISPAGVSSAKGKQKIPETWFDKICHETGASRAWLKGKEITEQEKLDFGLQPSPTKKQVSNLPTPSPTSKKTAKDVNVAEIISQAIDVLESGTFFSKALVSSIQAFHKAMCTENQIKNFNTEMLEAFSAFQKNQGRK